MLAVLPLQCTGSCSSWHQLLSFCAQATFSTPTTLVLQRPAATVASFRAGGRSAGEPTAAFASAAPGARFVDSRGQWLGQPDALLQGTVNGVQSDVLLTLSQPAYDAAAQVRKRTRLMLSLISIPCRMHHASRRACIKSA